MVVTPISFVLNQSLGRNSSETSGSLYQWKYKKYLAKMRALGISCRTASLHLRWGKFPSDLTENGCNFRTPDGFIISSHQLLFNLSDHSFPLIVGDTISSVDIIISFFFQFYLINSWFWIVFFLDSIFLLVFRYQFVYKLYYHFMGRAIPYLQCIHTYIYK